MTPTWILFIGSYALAEEISDKTAAYSIIGAAIILSCFYAYNFISKFRDNKAKVRAYDESQVKKRIDEAVSAMQRELDAKVKELTQSEAKLAAALLETEQCERRMERVETKANEVARQDAVLKGSLEDFMRLINSLLDDGCPHCHRPILNKPQ